MELNGTLKQFSERVVTIKDQLQTEEATKTALIMPFFQMLGYDVFNPLEFIPEYIADVGIKKGEKVDYAIKLNDEIAILIEAKSVNEKLEKHDSQLFRYFGVSKAKFAILTNGIEYKFYTDLEEQNKMDTSPFFIFNLLDFTENEANELKKFCKANFDVNKIIDTASELKYINLIRNVLKNEFTNPSDDFVKLILSENIYDGMKTQSVIDKYKPLVKKSISLYLNDVINDKIQNALKANDIELEKEVIEIVEDDPTDNIITTEEELQAFYIVKSILGTTIPLDRVSYKDTASYFSVIIDNKVTRWICRVFIKENVKYVIIPNETDNLKYTITTPDDIYQLSSVLKSRTEKLMK